jgi:hypothetical protein
MKKLFSLCSILFLFSQYLKAEIPQIEKDALLSIAENFSYPNGWSNDIPFEQWNGIVIENINGNDYVVNITISKNFNNQTSDFNLSNDYNNFSHLKYLRFSLSGNSAFKVYFDFEKFENIASLESFYLLLPSNDNNTYNTILQNLDRLPNIPNLTTLEISFNSPTFTLPTNFSNFNHLKSFTYQNYYGEFPNNFFGINSLEEIRINCNINYSFPPYIENLDDFENLKKFTISSTPTYSFFNGSLPDTLYNLPNLEELTLEFSTNSSLEISNSVLNYTNKLKYLSLHAGQLYFHDNLWNLNTLEELVLNSSNFSLVIPIQIENLPNINALSLVTNSMVHIPPTIKNLDQLTRLSVLPEVESDFPEEFYQIPNLKSLTLNVFNQIPSEVSEIPTIEELYFISTNGLLSSLPYAIGEIENLKKLSFTSSNNINQNLIQFPTNYFNWPNLTYFSVYHLNTEIDLTNKFFNMPNLEYLGFNHYNNSQVSGFLNLCNNPKLKTLNLNNSSITGVDVRNNLSFTNGELEYMSFNNNPITKFLVDDVNVFNQLRDENKIRITNNTTNFTVETSNSDCFYVLGTSENLNESSYKIYPNPVKDHLYIESLKDICNVEIRDLSGKKIAIDSDNPKIFVGLLPKGIYILKFQMDGIYYKEKFIKK